MDQLATTVSVLAVLPSREDQASLEKVFHHSKWNLHFTDSVKHGRVLMDEPGTGVVITGCSLPDGGWADVLRLAQRRSPESPVIVASRFADERLWAEVLNLGGYDVLAMPFHFEEVVHSVSLAWRHWRDKKVESVAPR